MSTDYGNRIDERLGIDRGWVLGASGQAVANGLNHNFRLMSILLQGCIKATQSSIPSSISDGDCYLVGSTATDEWLGKDGMIAQYDASLSDWIFVNVRYGFCFYFEAENKQKIYTDQGWKNVVLEV